MQGLLEQVTFWRRVALIASAIAFTSVVGALDDGEAAQVTAKIEAETHARKVEPLLLHPLDCDFTMRVIAAGVVERETCYARKEPQVWL